MRAFRTVLLVLVSMLIVAAGMAARRAGPSIEGNYVLDYRELPDGKQVRAPAVLGMMSFTKDRRNFNVYWTDNGKASSISSISKYTLSDSAYTEECMYYAMNDGAGGKGITYETAPSTGKAPVNVTGDKVEMKFPLHDEPAVVFHPAGLTATRAGAFVDHWKKVE